MLLGRLAAAARTPLAVRSSGLRVRQLAAPSGPKGYGEGPYRGVEPHLPGFWHTSAARACGAMMWLWIFYRAKVDGLAFWGLEHHYDHVDADELRSELQRFAPDLEYMQDEEKVEEIIAAVASSHHH